MVGYYQLKLSWYFRNKAARCQKTVWRVLAWGR